MNSSCFSTPIKKYGFTLIEVLVALFVAMIAAVPVVNIVRQAIINTAEQRKFVTLRALAKREMDRLLSMEFDELVPGRNTIRETISGVSYSVEIDILVLSPQFKHNNVSYTPGGPMYRGVTTYTATDRLKRIDVRASCQGVARTLNFYLTSFKADLRT